MSNNSLKTEYAGHYWDFFKKKKPVFLFQNRFLYICKKNNQTGASVIFNSLNLPTYD